MRFTDFSSSEKVTAASGTVKFDETDIPIPGLINVQFGFTGAGMTVGDIARIKCKADGTEFINITWEQYKSALQRYDEDHTPPADADTQFTLNFNHWWIDDDEGIADLSQFPRNASKLSIELVLDAGAAAGTCTAGYTISDVKPLYYPFWYSNSSGWASATATNKKYPFNEPGLIKALQFPSAGLSRLRGVFVGGKGQRFNADAVRLREMALNGVAAASPLTDPFTVDIGGPRLESAVVALQGSYLEGDTVNVTWLADGEFGILAYRPQ